MRGSRMRPVVKVEDGVGGAVADEGLQPEADAGQPWQRRRLSEAGAAVSDEALSRRAYLEAQALAVEGMERTRVLGEELLQAKALNAKLEAEVRIKDGIIQSKDDQHKAEIRFKDEVLQSKDALLSFNLKTPSFNPRTISCSRPKTRSSAFIPRAWRRSTPTLLPSALLVSLRMRKLQEVLPRRRWQRTLFSRRGSGCTASSGTATRRSAGGRRRGRRTPPRTRFSRTC